METKSTLFFEIVRENFAFLQSSELNYQLIQQVQDNVAYITMFKSKNRLLIVIYDLKEQEISINVIREDSNGFWATTNDWKNSISVDDLYYQLKRQSLSPQYQPRQIGLQKALTIQSKLLYELAYKILLGSEWISTEDILGTPKKFTTAKMYYR